jgi:2-iminobutanoate/2-iminopropanoate deaminase
MGKGSLGRAGSHGLLGVPGAHGGSCILRDIPLESSFNTIFTFAPLAPFRAHLEEPVMSKEIISAQESAGTLAAYSQGVKAAGLVFVAGQGPFDPRTGEVVGTTIQEQTAQCLRNVQAVLRAAGSSLDKAVSATFILAEEDDFPGMNEEWAKWFAKDPPARQGAKLPIAPKGMRISIALIAEA